MKNKRVVALLPMKANSDRVKGKNFKDFLGKPLFKWILDTLLQIDQIDQVVINTDARHILEKNGLRTNNRILIRDRKTEICGDMVSMNTIIEDDIASVDANAYLMTHTTNPLLKADTLREALHAFKQGVENGEADSLFSVNRIQTRFYWHDGSPVNHDPDNLVRTQDLEPWFEENSNLYIFTKGSFSKTHARIGERPMMFENSAFESIDIDTPDDWDLALIAARYLAEQSGSGL
jgi:CMP-N-acetylneuraminic acid synthetase